MAFDLNNFVIDRIVRGIALSQSNGEVLFSINQIENPSLSMSSESTDATDALGTPIATFYRSKTCEFSAENALFDMNLMAVQSGTSKKVASATDKIATPCFETIEVTGATTYTLAHVPNGTVSNIYLLNGDSTLGTVYTVNTTASATNFSINGAIITPPTGLAKGEQLFVIYEYDAEGAVSVTNSANNFPTGCKFIMEILGCDVCDQTNLIYAYLVFPNAKISPDFDWSIATDSTHPFSLRAMQEYCSKENRLFQIVIPE